MLSHESKQLTTTQAYWLKHRKRSMTGAFSSRPS
jgi:hypothetical protein